MEAGDLGPQPGQMLSHYRLVEKIGEGGMGVVWKAHDEKLNRTVALKVLKPDLVGDEEHRHRFLREARSAAAVTHPYIAAIHDADEADGTLFIAMEFVEGQTLRALVSKKPLPLEDALRYATEIAEGLSQAHQSQLVHRDLKPDNVMVASNGHTKILDFGLSKLIATRDEAATLELGRMEAEPSQLTDRGEIIGTPAYMSPEQARSMAVDARSDVFSFGATLYEVITGRPPFRGSTPVDILASILAEQATPPSQINRSVPPELEQIVLKCLEKNPEKRYYSAHEVLTDLRNLVPEIVSISSLAAESAEGGRRGLTRFRRTVAPAVVLVGLGAWAFVHWMPRAPEPPSLPSSPTAIAILPFTVRGSSNVAYLGEGMVDLLSTQLDGAGELRSVDPRALLAHLARDGVQVSGPIEARAVAERFGAGLYVLGSIIEVGERIRIGATLYEAKPQGRTRTASVQGDAAQIFALVDQLGAELIADLAAGRPDARLTKIAAITTPSLPALKAYLDGEAKLRRGDYTEALEAFQAAIGMDSSFALAYYRVAIASEWALRGELASAAAEAAVRHSDRLSDHDRQLLEASLALRRGAHAEAERTYHDILSFYPEDLFAWEQLGEVQYHYGPLQGRPAATAREAFQQVLSFDPDHVPSIVHLARIAAAENKHVELDSLVERIMQLGPGSDRAVVSEAVRAFAIGDPADQEHVLAKLGRRGAGVIAISVQNVAACTRNLEGATRIARLLMTPARSDEERGYGHTFLAYVEVSKGRWHAALRELASAQSLLPAWGLEHLALMSVHPDLARPSSELEAVRDSLRNWDAAAEDDREPHAIAMTTVHSGLHAILRAYLLCMLSARLGDGTAARLYAGELEDELRAAPADAFGWGLTSLPGDFVQSARAQIANADGRLDDALAALDDASMEIAYGATTVSPFFSQAFDRYARARLLERLGRPQEALPWYGSFDSIAFDLAYQAPSHKHRADIYTSLGDHERAAQHYARFIELWKDCDPEFQPMIDEARQALAKAEAKL